MRTAAFLLLCVIYSGIIGPRIINRGFVDKDGFWVYGWAGKAGLFGALAMVLLIRRRQYIPKLNAWLLNNLTWLIMSIAAAVLSWLTIGKIESGATGIFWPVAANSLMLSSVIFAAGGTFGPANLRLLGKAYRRELLLSTALAAAFWAFLAGVYDLWAVLSSIVLHVVSGMLGVIGLSVFVHSPRTLILSKFSIEISKYCSGVDSIALFTALYVLVGILDWHRLNIRRYLAIFPAALIVLFACNILRVFVLIVAGYYINPKIAFNLFHTYAGMVFFIIYSAIFWAVSYRWMIKSPAKKS